MPFLLAEILNFQGSTHRIGVGSFSNVEVPGLTYRNADPLEFSECASIASPRRPCLSVQSTRVWPQGRQSAAQAHEGKIPQGLRFCMSVPELRTLRDTVP